MSKSQKVKRKVDNIEKSVGKTAKALRRNAGYSQEYIGEYLGLTFQQIQKYEAGTNRMGPSVLYRLANLYDVSVNDFFVGLKKPVANCNFVLDEETLELIDLFQKVKNSSKKELLLSIIRELT